jgi:hypothetical protein
MPQQTQHKTDNEMQKEQTTHQTAQQRFLAEIRRVRADQANNVIYLKKL